MLGNPLERSLRYVAHAGADLGIAEVIIDWLVQGQQLSLDENHLVVTGVVRDGDGQPMPGAVVYVCQTDARGCYSANQVGSDVSPRLFAYLRTAGDGSYGVRTIRPAGHPNSQIPPHIHYEVSATGHRKFVSDFFFADEPQLKGNDRKHAERTRSLVTISRDPGGVQRCVIDATLSREGG